MSFSRRSSSGLVALIVLLATVASSLTFVPVARASDFWDEVKNPGLRHYRLNLAASQEALRARRFTEARERASLARDLFPERVEAYLLSGIAAGEEELDDELVTNLTRGLDLFEEGTVDSRLLVRAATTAARAHEFEIAVPFLRSVLRTMRPGSHRNHLFCLFADSLMALGPGQLSDAVRAYREAARRPGTFRAQARIGLSLALRRQGQPDWRTHLEGLTERDLERVNTQVLLPEGERAARDALYRESQDDDEGARAGWELAMAVEPWSEFTRAQIEAMDSD